MELSFKNQHMCCIVLCNSATCSKGEVIGIDKLADPKHVLLHFHMSDTFSALHGNSCSRNRIPQLKWHIRLGLWLGYLRIRPGQWFLKFLLWLLGLLFGLSLRVTRFWGLLRPLSITEAAEQGQCHEAHGGTLHHHGFTTTSELDSSLGAVRKMASCGNFYNTVSINTCPPLILATPLA